MHRAHFLGASLAVWLPICPFPARAQSCDALPPPGLQEDRVVGLADVRGLALNCGMTARLAALQVDEASAALLDARRWAADPVVEIEAPRRWGGTSEGEWEARVSQELNWPGHRTLRIERASLALESAQALHLEVRRRLLRDVERAFRALEAAAGRVRAAEQARELAESLATAVRSQVEEGEVSRMQGELVAIEAARAESRLLRLRQERRSRASELASIVGMPPEWADGLKTGAGSGPPWARFAETPLDSTVIRSLARRPDLRSARAEVAVANAAERLARRRVLPTLAIAALGEGSGGRPTRVGVGVTATLPVFDRGKGDRARAAVARLAAEAREIAVERSVRAEVSRAYATLVAAGDELTLATSRVLEPAREQQQLLESAYAEGAIDLPSVLLLRAPLVESELEYWDTWERFQMAEVDLRSATGAILDQAPAPEDLR